MAPRHPGKKFGRLVDVALPSFSLSRRLGRFRSVSRAQIGGRKKKIEPASLWNSLSLSLSLPSPPLAVVRLCRVPRDLEPAAALHWPSTLRPFQAGGSRGSRISPVANDDRAGVLFDSRYFIRGVDVTRDPYRLRNEVHLNQTPLDGASRFPLEIFDPRARSRYFISNENKGAGRLTSD